MQLQQIRYFLAICYERNFTRAAKRCGISQPSLTMAMRRLERAADGDLFVRSSPIHLTELGSALHPLFTQIIETVDSVHGIIQRHTANRRIKPNAAAADSAREGDAIS